MIRSAGASLAGALALALTLLFAAAAPPEARAQQIEVKGKRLSVFAPATDAASARWIAAHGDFALERYAADLGIAIPDTRFKIFLYATEAEYVKAEEVRTKGVFRTNLAFTYARDGEVHMVFQPRPNRGPVSSDATGMLEALAMHELSHALQYKAVPSYDEQPDWLSEGFAEMCAERAVGGEDRGCIERTPWWGDFILDVREALDIGTFVPLERLIQEGLQGKDVQDRQVRYGESFALVRLLDSPDDEARRGRFRAFMREVMALPPGNDVAARANTRFREIFGTPVKGEGPPSLAPLERELVSAIEKAEVFPWQIIFRDLRAAPDGSLIVESFPASSALSVSSAAPLGPRARIRATVTIAPGGGQQADVIFAYRGPNNFYKLAFGCAGYVTLMRFDGAYKSIANATCPSELLAPGAPHELDIYVDVARLAAKVDGRPAFRFALPDRTFGAGRYGIGAYDGRTTFRDVSGSSY